MPKINILVSCHTDSYVPKNKIIQPIQVGVSLASKKIEGMLYDNEGENISDKNYKFCEMTAQYWAWKNLDSDYYGFFHYRRYLSFNETKFHSDEYKNVFYNKIDERFVEDMKLNEEDIENFIGDNDIVCGEPMDFKADMSLKGKKTVYTHYEQSPNHNIKDFDFVLDYIKQNLPDYYDSAMEYANSRYGYFLNMYVMKKEIFFNYCQWLFPILEAFDKQKDYSLCNTYATRTAGLLAERLFGVYLTYLKNHKKDLKLKLTQQAFVMDASNPCPAPFKSENNIPICLGCDDNYVPLASNVIKSIMSNAKAQDNYDIFLITNEVSEFNKQQMQLELCGYSNVSLRFINGNCFINDKKLYEKQHINRSTYLRFAMLEFMKNYDKAIYLDCDLVVNHDIAEFFNINIDGFYFGAVRDWVELGWCNYKDSEQKKYNEKYLEIKNQIDYFNAGVLLVNLSELRKDGFTTEKLYGIAELKPWRWQDQDVLNYICKDKKVKYLDGKWNVMVHHHQCFSETPESNAPKQFFDEYKKCRNNPYIVHYVGRSVPCFCPTADIPQYFWKYARQSVFYEKILNLMAENAQSQTNKKKKAKKEKLLKRVANKFFPKGTKRRERLKSFVKIFKH